MSGGGHSVAGHAVVDDGVMIDLRPMSRVRVDPEQRIAWCGGGANWGELDRETQAFGLAVTGGRIADTGVGGLTLGGGSGWLERKYGFTVDSLLSAEVVTADGRLVVASARPKPGPVLGAQGRRRQLRRGDRLRVPPARGRPARLRRHDVASRSTRPSTCCRPTAASWRTRPDEICGGSAILCAPPEEFVPEEVRGKPVLALIACYVARSTPARAPCAAARMGRRRSTCSAPMPYTGCRA